ncbi:uncharacterized protein LOC106662395 isoform X2 [Cimex lectularius]|uniref:Uncharacterized protein n=1 Tax=Cimex lectularius TaxID=79782 RepID=A0A8I6RB86_CIMLE|nr:uncharacterized protein LOC106662395 isoform X2 [Cimex lectularius]
MMSYYSTKHNLDKPGNSQDVAGNEKPRRNPKVKRFWRAITEFNIKRKCYLLSFIQAMFSVILCILPIIELFYFNENFVERMGIFLGTFLVPTMVTVNTLLYIFDIFVQWLLIYSVMKTKLREIQMVIVYSLFAPMIEAVRVIICVNFEFIMEIVIFSIALIYRLLILSTLQRFRRTLSTGVGSVEENG